MTTGDAKKGKTQVEMMARWLPYSEVVSSGSVVAFRTWSLSPAETCDLLAYVKGLEEALARVLYGEGQS